MSGREQLLNGGLKSELRRLEQGLLNVENSKEENREMHQSETYVIEFNDRREYERQYLSMDEKIQLQGLQKEKNKHKVLQNESLLEERLEDGEQKRLELVMGNWENSNIEEEYRRFIVSKVQNIIEEEIEGELIKNRKQRLKRFIREGETRELYGRLCDVQKQEGLEVEVQIELEQVRAWSQKQMQVQDESGNINEIRVGDLIRSVGIIDKNGEMEDSGLKYKEMMMRNDRILEQTEGYISRIVDGRLYVRHQEIKKQQRIREIWQNKDGIEMIGDSVSSNSIKIERHYKEELEGVDIDKGQIWIRKYIIIGYDIKQKGGGKLVLVKELEDKRMVEVVSREENTLLVKELG